MFRDDRPIARRRLIWTTFPASPKRNGLRLQQENAQNGSYHSARALSTLDTQAGLLGLVGPHGRRPVREAAAAALDHRRSWEAMDAIGEEQLDEIERRVVAAMVETFGLDLSGLVLDMTNFATYIDSANDRAPSPSVVMPSRSAGPAPGRPHAGPACPGQHPSTPTGPT